MCDHEISGAYRRHAGWECYLIGPAHARGQYRERSVGWEVSASTKNKNNGDGGRWTVVDARW